MPGRSTATRRSPSWARWRPGTWASISPAATRAGRAPTAASFSSALWSSSPQRRGSCSIKTVAISPTVRNFFFLLLDRERISATPGIARELAAMIDDIPVWKILEGLLFHIDRRRPVVFLALKLFGLRGLRRVAPAGKREMEGAEYLRGARIEPGAQLPPWPED